MNRFWVVVAASALSCARGAPHASVVLTHPPMIAVASPPASTPETTRAYLVAPLRGEKPPPNTDSELRTTPPPTASVGAAPPPLPVQSFRLGNGLQAIVVERHTFPVVAATLAVDLAQVAADDAGQRRAEVLAKTFFVSNGEPLQASGGCSVVACFLHAGAAAERLKEVLQSVADRATHATIARDDYERRASSLSERVQDPVNNNAKAMLFGKFHPYGGPLPSTLPTWTEIDGFRRSAFVPAAATLAVVGDVSVDIVRSEVARVFGSWAGPPRPAPVHSHGAWIHASSNALAMVANGGRRVGVGVAAVGPAPRQHDAAAFEVIAQLLGGGGLDSTLFHHVHEDMGIAYSVGGSVQWFTEASMMTMVGSFDGADVFGGTRAILAQIAALRDAEPTADDIDRAKGTALAAWRRQMSTDQGIAQRLATAAVQGVGAVDALAWPERLRAVTAATVQDVAKRYLMQRALRIVFVGRPEFVGTAASLGLGAPVAADFAGREVTTGSEAQVHQ